MAWSVFLNERMKDNTPNTEYVQKPTQVTQPFEIVQIKYLPVLGSKFKKNQHGKTVKF